LEPSETEVEAPVTPTAPASQPPQQTVEAIDSDISDQATAISQRPQAPTKRPTLVRKGSFGGSSTTTTTRRAPSRRIESPLSSYSRSGVDIFAQSGNGARSGISARNTGNATTTNYAGLVLAQLNRTASVPVSGAGWAQVIFVISANGALASVDIIDSSGSRSINSAARQQVRSAAPFPPPPSGKSRRLSFSYQTQ
jgi:TonB family protein